MRLTRRRLLQGAGCALFGTLVSGGYAFGYEPFSLRIQRYSVTPPGWPHGLRLKIAALADIHACRPWMDPDRIRSIAEQASRLQPDLIVLLGDYMAGHRWVTAHVPAREWAAALSGLTARLGVYAILGNHDWWDDRAAQKARKGPVVSRLVLEDAGIPVLENDVVRIENGGSPFWVAGLGDQLALKVREDRRRYRGVDDLPGTLAKVTDGAPVVLLAHEPDIFPRVPSRVALTLSGHTHGGQVRLFGYAPVVPSRYGNRYAYGHIVEAAAEAEAAGTFMAGMPTVETGAATPRHLVVSGGLGCSLMPVRVGVPPEITVVEVGAWLTPAR
jgi:predicted MPP superfamily phosphohydrolase